MVVARENEAAVTHPRAGARSSPSPGVGRGVAGEGEARVRAAFGDNYERLAALKKKYDPANLFRVNQNIRPAP